MKCGISRRSLLASTAGLLLPGQADAWTHGRAPVGTGTLPAGVTLQAIDGETMLSSLTMSHNFFGGRGLTTLTNAAYSAGTPGWWQGLSWDDPKFFMISVFWCNTGSANDTGGKNLAQRFVDIGINTCLRCDGTQTMLVSNGIWLIADTPQFSTAAQCIGFNIDEPTSIVGAQGTANGSISSGQSSGPVGGLVSTANASQDTRAWHVNFTWYAYQGFLPNNDVFATALNQTYTTPNSTLRRIDIVSVDQYWFATATTAGGLLNQNGQWQGIGYGSAGTATLDNWARGSHYGDGIDYFRSVETTNKVPACVFIETGDGLVGSPNTGIPISPAQLHWAIWSTITHGARGIALFTDAAGNTAFNSEPNAQNVQSDSFGDPWWQTAQSSLGSQWSVSTYAQLKADCQLVGSLASMLNSPFALAYASVSPSRYVFPTYTLSLSSGIDISVHFFNHQFWIIATTSFSQTATGISATFTVADLGANLAIGHADATNHAISGGTFTVTFANASDVHIYQIQSSTLWG